MNISQMLRHCVLCEELYLGKIYHKRSFLERLFGKVGLKNILNENKPFPKNAPTTDAFKVEEESGDIEWEKKKRIQLIEQYGNHPGSFVHWFWRNE